MIGIPKIRPSTGVGSELTGCDWCGITTSAENYNAHCGNAEVFGLELGRFQVEGNIAERVGLA